MSPSSTLTMSLTEGLNGPRISNFSLEPPFLKNSKELPCLLPTKKACHIMVFKVDGSLYNTDEARAPLCKTCYWMFERLGPPPCRAGCYNKECNSGRQLSIELHEMAIFWNIRWSIWWVWWREVWFIFWLSFLPQTSHKQFKILLNQYLEYLPLLDSKNV